MTDLQKVLLETFKAFSALCNEYNLRYYAAFGTALGAVRHQGFIPWDDDIDVYMPRQDYNKFIALRDRIEEAYSIVDLRDTGYFMYFAKFINNQTTVWEKRELPFLYGVFIDIFPLDYYDEEKSDEIKKENKLFSKAYLAFFKSNRECSLSFSWQCLKTGAWITFLKAMETLMLYRPLRNKYLKRINNHIQYFSSLRGDKLCRYSPDLNESNVYPVNWFEEGVELPFEDTTIVIPKAYDSYLQVEFGEYMIFPPVEKRVSNHNIYFLDLYHHYSIDEVNRIMNIEKNSSLS